MLAKAFGTEVPVEINGNADYWIDGESECVRESRFGIGPRATSGRYTLGTPHLSFGMAGIDERYS